MAALKALERSFIAIEQGNSSFILGILVLFWNSSFLGVRRFLLSKI